MKPKRRRGFCKRFQASYFRPDLQKFLPAAQANGRGSQREASLSFAITQGTRSPVAIEVNRCRAGEAPIAGQDRPGLLGLKGAAGSNPRKTYRQETDRFAPKKKVRSSIPDAARLEARQAKKDAQQADQPQRTTPPGETEFKTGDRVTHSKFGQGIVMSSKLTGSDEEVTIAFTQEGVKRLIASFAKLEKI